MILVENITQEFLEDHYFTLDKPYGCEKYDADGFSTGEWLEFEVGSEWECTENDYIGGEIHLEGLSLSYWIELPEDIFKEYFTAHKWQRAET